MGSPFRKFSDAELVQSVCGNNPDAIVFFFYEKYLPVFQYHIIKLFPGGTNIRELVDEFFLYLYEDGWRRLRTYQPDKASLATWVSVISFRFFNNYKHNRLDSKGVVTPSAHWEAYAGDWVSSNEAGIRMDIDAAIEAIPNSRDREIAKMIFLEDEEFKTVADRFELSVDYVYTVKNRLIRQLKSRLSGYH
ncbi:MAG: sigma-70 family RNA polymerase sigma factor [Candidatus Cryptobacteroides sp.]